MQGLKRLVLYALLAVVFWAGAFGIAYSVVEWRGENVQPSADMRCEAALRLFEHL